MTPFLQLRVWWRQAPSPERQVAMVAIGVVLALVAWALVPSNDGEAVSSGGLPSATANAPAGGGASSPRPTTSAGEVATPSPGAGPVVSPSGATTGATVASGASGPAATATACQNLGASDQGVTEQQVHVGVGIFDLGGSTATNQVVGYRDDSDKIIDALVGDINKAGGIACRKLVVSTYRVSPLDANDQRSKCLQAAQDKVFAFLDAQGMTFEAAEACLTRENKIPMITPVGVPNSFFEHQGGWMIGTNATGNQQLRNAILGAAAAGAFDPAKGFTKLGLLDDRCAPEFGDDAKALLRQLGVNDVVEFTLDCGQFVAPPNQTQQAVLQHKNAGVSHVLTVTGTQNLQVYLTGAKQLSFKPTYLGGDMYGATSPSQSKNFDADQYDGTIAYSVQTYGATAAKVPLTPAAARCSQQMQAHGLPSITDEGKDDPVLWYCDVFALLTEMAKRTSASAFTRANFVAALPKVGRIPFARTSDGVYDRPGKFTGASAYRKIQWQRGCTCWKVLDPTFRPNG